MGLPVLVLLFLIGGNNKRAEPGATANEHACHGLCSEQHTPRQARSSLSLNVRQKNKNPINVRLPVINPRMRVPTIAALIPAAVFAIGGVYLFSQSKTYNVLLHPIGILMLISTLLVIAIPIRLALYIANLNHTSPNKQIIWALMLCSVPAICLVAFIMATLELGASVGHVFGLIICSCYVVAFISLLMVLIQSIRKSKNENGA